MALLQCETGGDLLSQAESDQVPSAQLDLTSVFEMGTGVTPALSLPRNGDHTKSFRICCRPSICAGPEKVVNVLCFADVIQLSKADSKNLIVQR